MHLFSSPTNWLTLLSLIRIHKSRYLWEFSNRFSSPLLFSDIARSRSFGVWGSEGCAISPGYILESPIWTFYSARQNQTLLNRSCWGATPHFPCIRQTTPFFYPHLLHQYQLTNAVINLYCLTIRVSLNSGRQAGAILSAVFKKMRKAIGESTTESFAWRPQDPWRLTVTNDKPKYLTIVRTIWRRTFSANVQCILWHIIEIGLEKLTLKKLV